MVDNIERAVAVRIFECKWLAAIVETTLRAEDAAELKLPRQFPQAVKLKRVGDGQIRWSFVQVWSIDECTSRRDKSSVGANKRSVLIRTTSSRFGYKRRYTDKAI